MIPSMEVVLTVGGWIVGAIIVVAGMRSQIGNLAHEISALRSTLDRIFARLDSHERRLSYLEGRASAVLPENTAPPRPDPLF